MIILTEYMTLFYPTSRSDSILSVPTRFQVHSVSCREMKGFRNRWTIMGQVYVHVGNTKRDTAIPTWWTCRSSWNWKHIPQWHLNCGSGGLNDSDCRLQITTCMVLSLLVHTQATQYYTAKLNWWYGWEDNYSVHQHAPQIFVHTFGVLAKLSYVLK